MKRTPSGLTQLLFNLHSHLIYRTCRGGAADRLAARVGTRLTGPLLRRAGKDHSVTADVYGQTLLMPSEHPILATVTTFPQYNRPLGLAALAIAQAFPETRHTVIDIGANIGETAALIEQWAPDTFSYLCLEPDTDLAEMCRLNHRNRSNLEIIRCFIGEQEGATVVLQDDGRANPSTKLSAAGSPSSGGQLVRLDTAADAFANKHGNISLIKVDTEGYDFSVLRSGSKILERYHPGVYFEWFPEALTAAGEDFYQGFVDLQSLGYEHFVFFTSQGNFYCNCKNPDPLFLHALASVVGPKAPFEYFDVFATTSKQVADKLIEASVAIHENENGRKVTKNTF